MGKIGQSDPEGIRRMDVRFKRVRVSQAPSPQPVEERPSCVMPGCLEPARWTGREWRCALDWPRVVR